MFDKSKILVFTIGLIACLIALPHAGYPADFMVYGVYRPLDLGDPGQTPLRDFYINMGASSGLQPGALVEVIRRIPTYDLEGQKLYTDIDFRIATLKVIHVERNAAIARLDKMLPPEETPAFAPRAVMVGDFVRRK